MSPPDPYICSACLAAAFVSAGIVQSAWLYSRAAVRFGRPIDGGRTFRGKRLLGDNKTWRGFVVMVPATGLAFLALGLLRIAVPQPFERGLWPVPLWQYALIGCWAGFAFMLAEFPNSFLKRQLDVAPGQTPNQRWAAAVCFVLDQTDSVLGALIAISLFVPVPLPAWVLLLVLGAGLHWLFNLVLFLVGAKTRPA